MQMASVQVKEEKEQQFNSAHHEDHKIITTGW